VLNFPVFAAFGSQHAVPLTFNASTFKKGTSLLKESQEMASTVLDIDSLIEFEDVAAGQ